MVRLTNTGFKAEEGKKWVKVPFDIDLLEYWTAVLTIDLDVKCRHLFELMTKADPGFITMIELLVNSNIKPYLDSWNQKPSKKVEEPLQAVEVYKVADINLGPTSKDNSIEIWPGCHGVGKPWGKKCDTYAIEFTSWAELKDVPLTIKPTLGFSEITWAKTKPRQVFANYKKWKINRKIKISRQLDIPCDMKLGEFFCGLTNELCFFQTPAQREAKGGELKSSMDSIDLGLGENKVKK